MTTGAGRKERPILFSGDMVLAILRGDKIQTRRVMGPQPKTAGIAGVYPDLYNHGPEWGFWLPDNRMTEPRTWKCPHGQPGDRLWVRETWCPLERCDWIKEKRENNVNYKADSTSEGESNRMEMGYQWKSPIFMPRWASRITLEITGIRVERVQDISEEDAKAEGFIVEPYQGVGDLPSDRFQRYWDRLNSKRGYSWKENPWVWVIEFKRFDSGPGPGPSTKEER